MAIFISYGKVNLCHKEEIVVNTWEFQKQFDIDIDIELKLTTFDERLHISVFQKVSSRLQHMSLLVV